MERPTLTPRQLSVLRQLADGHTLKQIADQRAIGYRTVKAHADAIRHSLAVPTLCAAVAAGFREELLT